MIFSHKSLILLKEKNDITFLLKCVCEVKINEKTCTISFVLENLHVFSLKKILTQQKIYEFSKKS